nr:hypothetical protein [Aquabacter cavernae]
MFDRLFDAVAVDPDLEWLAIDATVIRATETDGVFDLCYRRHPISRTDLRDNVVKPVHHVPEQPSSISQV